MPELFSGTSVFVIPILDQFLLYAPLHNLAALIDGGAVRCLRDACRTGKAPTPHQLNEISALLQTRGEPEPAPSQGEFVPPFLGLLPTRGCNLGCRYCGFLTPEASQGVMQLELARDAVNWYMDVMAHSGAHHAEIHYFGGEPFCAEDVLDLTVPLGRKRAAEIGCTVRFETATNGVFGETRCQWAADNLDTIVLSLDGPADIQDHHRPYKNGQGSFEAVARTARLLSQGPAELYIRACVTSDTAARMPSIASWFCERFRPSGVCFEPLQPSESSARAGLEPPDPWAFAQGFVEAAWILEARGVEPICATADIHARRVSFCPVGQDVAIVSPDGTIDGCYLLRQEWEAKGLDLRLGHMEDGQARLESERVAAVRALNVHHKPLCARCFCKWHCAGGCHVNHGPAGPTDGYDRLCIQTRVIALRNILKTMDRNELVRTWLDNREAVERAICQPSDLLIDQEPGR